MHRATVAVRIRSSGARLLRSREGFCEPGSGKTDNRSGPSYDRPHPLVDLAIGRIVEEVSRSRSSGDGNRSWLGSSTRWQFFPMRGARVFPTTPKNIQKPTRDSSALRHPIESRNQWALVSGGRRDR
jgi:hypothetical protein